MTKKAEEYSADTLLTLDDRTHLIKRMGLTFGPEGTNPDYPYSQQKTVAVREIIDNSTDEIRSGYGSHVRLTIRADHGVEVMDSGRGIPVDVNHTTHESGIYMSLGKTQSGGKFSTDSNSFTSGLNGVGGGSVALVSRAMFVTVYRAGKRYSLDFHNGLPGFFAKYGDPTSKFTSLKDMGKDNSYLKVEKDTRPASVRKDYKTGTTVLFWLDDSAFVSSKPIDDLDLVNRLKFTAFLTPELSAEAIDECHPVDGEPLHEQFHYPDGIVSMVDYLAPNDKLIPIQHIVTEGHYVEQANVLTPDGSRERVVKKPVERRIPIEVAWTYSPDASKDRDYRMESFVNSIYTKLGGVHEKAFERALVKSFVPNMKPSQGLKKADEPPRIDDFMEGLTVVLSVQQSEPMFDSQAKESLSGSENQKAIQAALEQSFTEWIETRKNKEPFDLMARKVIQASQVRQHAEEQRQLKRKANSIASSSMPSKLKDCEFAGSEGTELLICEGDSASGALTAARDAQYQAVLPVRGKGINAAKASAARLMANEEVQFMIKALGAGWGKDFQLDKMRYSRVIFATDADDDGYHIQDLLLIIFWTLFKPAVLDGRVFVAVPPLYEVTSRSGDLITTLVTPADLEEFKHKQDNAGKKPGSDYLVDRTKGLGQNDAEVLWETMLNPLNRVLKQIDAKDIEAIQSALAVTNGSDVSIRKNWIESTAGTIEDED